MRASVKKKLCVLLCAVMLFGVMSQEFLSYALYNDARFDNYENMREKTTARYTVPTLFKNDAVFSNYKKTPLVVQDGTEYVPIDMFSGLSDIDINTKISNRYFYIQNKATGAYISFDIKSDLATTHEREPHRLRTAEFYETRYIPAREVARVLGVTCEIYDSLADGVYALRLSDGSARLTVDELIKLYSPVKKEPTPPVVEDPIPQGPDVPDTPGISVGRRTVYLSFELYGFGYVKSILDTLSQQNVKATFFCDAQQILDNSDTVRRMINSGHTVGLLLDGSDTYGSYTRAKDALRLVTKKSSRLVRFKSSSRSCTLTDAELSEFIRNNGLCLWDHNIRIYDSPQMYDTLVTALSTLQMRYGTTEAILNITQGPNTSAMIVSLASLAKQTGEISFSQINETHDSVSFRNID